MSIDELLTDRIDRAGLKLRLSPLALQWSDRVKVGVASSHLGTDPNLQSEVSRYLSRCALECRQAGHVMMVAAHSAIETLARRAAELFSVPLVILYVSHSLADPIPSDRRFHASVICTNSNGKSPQRDSALIALADRIDAVMVRGGGRIDIAIRKRLVERPDATVRVAIHKADVSSKQKSAAQDLMTLGAVGWYQLSCENRDPDQPQARESAASTVDDADVSWMQTDGQWLVHCTRTPSGPMPGQTIRQHQDALLLSDDPAKLDGNRSPLDALRRIVRSRRLVANAIASAHQWPVVCFSANALVGLLKNRRYRPHLKRWDYEPWGIAVRTGAAIEKGIEPVIYGDPVDRKQLAEQQQYRFQSKGKTYDWTAEREWRSSIDVDFAHWNESDVRVFVPSADAANQLAPDCRWRIDVIGGLLKRSVEQPMNQLRSSDRS